MCLIAYKRANAKTTIKTDSLKTAARVNPHGWGIMYAKEGKLVIHKGFDDSWIKLWEGIPNEYPAAIHFRYSTGGRKNRENCHPFLVHSGGKDAPAIGLMHNGILPYRVAQSDKDRSDTANFVQDMRPMLRKNPALLKSELFRDMLGDFIGPSNKFIFMDSAGKVFFANENKGKWLWGTKDVWVSNEYSFNEAHRDKPATSHPATNGGDKPATAPNTEGYYGNARGGYQGFYGFSEYDYSDSLPRTPATPATTQPGLPYVGGDKPSRARQEQNPTQAALNAERAAPRIYGAKGNYGFTPADLEHAVNKCDGIVSQGGTLSFSSDEGFRDWCKYVREVVNVRRADIADAMADRNAGITTEQEEEAAIAKANADAAAFLASQGITDPDAEPVEAEAGGTAEVDGEPVDMDTPLSEAEAEAQSDFEKRFAEMHGRSFQGKSARRFQAGNAGNGKSAPKGGVSKDGKRIVFTEADLEALRTMSAADMLEFCRDDPETAADMIEAFVAQFGDVPPGVFEPLPDAGRMLQ